MGSVDYFKAAGWREGWLPSIDSISGRSAVFGLQPPELVLGGLGFARGHPCRDLLLIRRAFRLALVGTKGSGSAVKRTYRLVEVGFWLSKASD